jgi:hypothetical protein
MAKTATWSRQRLMGHWGVQSYENDEAADAIDAGFEKAHGALYEALMDDRNSLSFEQVQQQLAGAQSLAASLDWLKSEVGEYRPLEEWEETDRLAYAGVVVRHAELGVTVPAPVLARAIDWLEHETIEWDEATARTLRRQREIHLLQQQSLGS